MAERDVKRVSRGRKLTPEEGEKYRRILAEIERNKPAIAAHVRARREELKDLADVFGELKKAREAQGLSLADVQERTGIDRSALSKLETGYRENYTLETVLRYAEAVGKRVVFSLAEAASV